jgi:cytochrome o ubiquinol oxidase operon protein cyoD
MSEPKPIVAKPETPSGSLQSYTVGFVLSLILTFTAYIIAVRDVAHGWALVYILATLAVVQLFVQLVFFLHVGRESKPRWNLTAAVFAAMVVGILVFGSLWIMKNLQYGHHHGPSPEQTDELIKHDEGYSQ